MVALTLLSGAKSNFVLTEAVELDSRQQNHRSACTLVFPVSCHGDDHHLFNVRGLLDQR